MQVEIDSKIHIGPKLDLEVTENDVRNEPMLFSVDYNFAIKNGGPLTRAFIHKLHGSFGGMDLLIDSRTHMLFEDMYPCIPGYHLDFIPREREDGQPSHSNPSHTPKHCMCIVGDCSKTEFAIGKSVFEEPPLGTKVYGEWHKDTLRKLESGELQRFSVPDKYLVYFDCWSLHQGMPATKNGWRWFIRATIGSDRKPKNEIRKQTQVYLLSVEGW